MPAPPAPPPRSTDDLMALLSPPVRALAARGEIRWFDIGERILVEGEAGDEIYVLLEGEVQALSSDPNDRDLYYSVDIAGGYFGEMALDGGRRSATVVATARTRCAVVTRRTVLQHVREDPEFAIHLLMKLIERAREATKRSKFVQENVYQRLKKALESIAVVPPAGSGALGVTPPVTHQALASRIGSSREMVSRVLKDLETGGVVRSEARRISILKTLPRDW